MKNQPVNSLAGLNRLYLNPVKDPAGRGTLVIISVSESNFEPLNPEPVNGCEYILGMKTNRVN